MVNVQDGGVAAAGPSDAGQSNALSGGAAVSMSESMVVDESEGGAVDGDGGRGEGEAAAGAERGAGRAKQKKKKGKGSQSKHRGGASHR